MPVPAAAVLRRGFIASPRIKRTTIGGRGVEKKSARQSLSLITEETAPDASHRLEGAEAESSLRAAIELLPENQRQILLLRYYGNLKFVEIAQMLGCPLNTALGRMHKAMIHLRKLLAEPRRLRAEPQNVESRMP